MTDSYAGAHDGGTPAGDAGAHDGGTPIPLVKFSGTPQVNTPLAAGADFLAVYEVVNMGTGPTTSADDVWCSVAMQNSVVHQAQFKLDSPPLEANGGSHTGSVHFDAHYFGIAGDWEAIFSINNAQGGSDETRVPFKVEGKQHDLEPSG